ncbi:MAG: hypothetical protein PUK59_08030 [Actinomycetaceae bacterium]|nr:hypothetical protein [Actinomycetaceae bacterium]
MAARFHSKIQVGIVAVLVAVIGVFAVLYDGHPNTDVDLHDGGVWVSNARESLVAHLNYSSRTLDGGLNPVTTQFDLSQEGNQVLLADQKAASFKAIDTATIKLSDPVAGGMRVAHGANLVLLADADKKKVWAMDYANLGSFSDGSKALLDKEAPAALAVTPDDHGFVLDATGTVTRVELGAEQPSTEQVGTFEVTPAKDAQFSAVGEQPVLLQNGTLYTLKGAFQLEGADAATRLQLGI